MRLFFLTVSSATLLLAGAAQADVASDRQALMKDLGRSVGSIAPMIKGEKPFDAATALAALEKIDAYARKLDAGTLFPDGSDKGDTEASPKIWENKDDFARHIEKFRADAATALTAKPQDLDALKPAFQQVAANCGACHRAYRIKKN
ncbi:cytochrome c556 [Ochrobactrum daejeonense]|uniref:Cytochrome c556 n=1 Tax=Brucella daejeonensis TaxID=659015 RepID=A0A7W9B007_9HYPH|nr:cytochrome c [Brucella daejeonensis]MBB5703736.1 cytochrome c556 [Brucella daejeonensis]NKB78751.1 cytochrome c [Brucella daejeonensis]